MKRVYSLFFVVLGNFIYALSVKLFLLPGNLITGGTNGIALVLDHYWGISISLFVLIFNIIMLCVGWLVLGRAFAMTTCSLACAWVLVWALLSAPVHPPVVWIFHP